MFMWELKVAEEWEYWYSKLDGSLLRIVEKRICRLEQEGHSYDHLGSGLQFFKDQFNGQYRICFREEQKSKTRILHFVGDHKNYEHWLGMRG